MLELIKQMESLGGLTVLFIFVVLLFAIKEGYNFSLQVKDIFNGYHKSEQKKTALEESVKNLQQRISAMEKMIQDDDFRDRISRMEDLAIKKDHMIEIVMEDLTNINNTLKKADEDRKNTTLNNAKNTMYRLHMEAKNMGYVTQVSLENFLSLADTYLNLGGNSYYKNVIIPSYLEFPVKDIQDVKGMEHTNKFKQEVKDKLEN